MSVWIKGLIGFGAGVMVAFFFIVFGNFGWVYGLGKVILYVYPSSFFLLGLDGYSGNIWASSIVWLSVLTNGAFYGSVTLALASLVEVGKWKWRKQAAGGIGSDVEGK